MPPTDNAAAPPPPVEITAGLVRALLREQHPDLADREIRLGAKGWDNQLWRVGHEFAVRLPWATDSADALLRKEYSWMPGLAAGLPLPVPVPQRLGEPSMRFPRPWIVTTWVPGAPADREPVTRGAEAAEHLAAFLTALHRPAPAHAPAGRNRGGSLREQEAGFEGGLAAAIDAGLITDGTADANRAHDPARAPEPAAAPGGGGVDARVLRAVWRDAVSAPDWDGPLVWLHADLHPANVLTADGSLCGVIDFGDLCAGDPACDLAAAWSLLPDLAAVERCLAAYRPSPDAAMLRRARGWALLRALSGLLIGAAGARNQPGGKPSWGPPARAALGRLVRWAEHGGGEGGVRGACGRP